MAPLQVFVYGTLKPGHFNYDRYCRNRLLASQPAKARGQLYDLPVGYPAMTAGTGWVYGQWLSLKPENGQTLAELDALEDYQPGDPQSLYQRVWLEIFSMAGRSLGQVYGYQMAIATVTAMGGILVPSGCWRD